MSDETISADDGLLIGGEGLGSGIAGPGGGSAEKPVGTVFIALATAAGCRAQGYRFSGSRDEVRNITAFTAMDWLRRHLLSL